MHAFNKPSGTARGRAAREAAAEASGAWVRRNSDDADSDDDGGGIAFSAGRGTQGAPKASRGSMAASEEASHGFGQLSSASLAELERLVESQHRQVCFTFEKSPCNVRA